jgi:hypothetical protein
MSDTSEQIRKNEGKLVHVKYGDPLKGGAIWGLVNGGNCYEIYEVIASSPRRVERYFLNTIPPESIRGISPMTGSHLEPEKAVLEAVVQGRTETASGIHITKTEHPSGRLS